MEEFPQERSVIDTSVNAMELRLDQLQVQGGLLVVEALARGQRLKMLVDSGATHSIVRRDLLATPAGTREQKIRARDFEGRLSMTTSRKFTVDMTVEDRMCSVELVEWPLRQEFDGILGQTWLRRENSDIDWSTEILSWKRPVRRNLPRERTPSIFVEPEIEYVDADEFQGLYTEVFHLDVVTDAGTVKPDAEVTKLVGEFAYYLRKSFRRVYHLNGTSNIPFSLRRVQLHLLDLLFVMPMLRKQRFKCSWISS
ncbi:hypothetical protein PPTG_12788 [Phytophthora nicotianae INRA-310]|uniref:Uncharacterized protein n=1 Tax=Phytophthora nicotianae (strain INRA-310) TaxID=761204 RepID=W2Q2G7_PHYN3|nr:hypothetical protein PPTG_12788 [Phytophthora nicotianae INRA-310]ETN06754.1 hypothetical protein PPTG_12788 [Phytophthora nicotianae INRA-310]